MWLWEPKTEKAAGKGYLTDLRLPLATLQEGNPGKNLPLSLPSTGLLGGSQCSWTSHLKQEAKATSGNSPFQVSLPGSKAGQRMVESGPNTQGNGPHTYTAC